MSDAFSFFEQQNPTSAVLLGSQQKFRNLLVSTQKSIKSITAWTDGVALLCRGLRGHSREGGGGHGFLPSDDEESCHLYSSPCLCRMLFVLFVLPEPPPRPFPCVCLFVSLRLRAVERRGHTEPPTEPIHQTPVTSETRSAQLSSAPRQCSHSVDSRFCWHLPFSPTGPLFLWWWWWVGLLFCSACPEIFTISKKSQRLCANLKWCSRKNQPEQTGGICLSPNVPQKEEKHTGQKQITAGGLIPARVEMSFQLEILTTFPSFKSVCVRGKKNLHICGEMLCHVAISAQH